MMVGNELPLLGGDLNPLWSVGRRTRVRADPRGGWSNHARIRAWGSAARDPHGDGPWTRATQDMHVQPWCWLPTRVDLSEESLVEKALSGRLPIRLSGTGGTSRRE